MKLVKPPRLACVHRVFAKRKNEESAERPRHFVAITVAYATSFDRPSSPVSEAEMWKIASTDLGRHGVLDHWMPKQKAEVLVTGACYPGGARTSSGIRLAIGSPGRLLVDKRLEVFGDRHWTLLGPSEPEPFTRMPIDWAHAFGGAGYPPNPIGKGFAPDRDPRGTAPLVELPNVEDPRHRISAETDRPQPATLAPWDPAWPHYVAPAGDAGREPAKPNEARREEAATWNVAPHDQRVKGFFEGTEPIRVENMHPERRVLEMTLPGYRARCFLRYADAFEPRGRLVEVSLNLDTLHLFPHRERVVVFFRGAAEVHTPDASDVALLVAALDESLEVRRPLEHFEEALGKRTGRDKKAYAFAEGDLMPPASIERAPSTPAPSGGEPRRTPKGRAEAELESARARLLADGLDPSLLPRAPAGAGDAGSAPRDDVEAERELERFSREHGIDLSALRASATSRIPGPPTFSAAVELAKLEATAQLSARSGFGDADLRDKLADPAFRASLVELERRLRHAYRMTAHLRDGAPPRASEAGRLVRAEAKAAVLAAPRGQRDFTGVDLAGEDLSGADLEGAFLEGANLEGANLEGANLAGAVLVGANLGKARFTGARLDGANLGRANARSASFARGSLAGAIVCDAECADADLSGADLSRASAERLRAEGARFDGAVASEIVLVGAKLAGASLRRTRLDRANLLDVDLRGADATGAELSRATIARCDFDRAVLREIVAPGVRIADSKLASADLREATLAGAALRGARLAGARLAGANLKKAELVEADLSGADLSQAIAAECLAIDADLSGAHLAGANLMLAVMHRADLRAADLSGANLFCADLTAAAVDDRTLLAGANVKRAIVPAALAGRELAEPGERHIDPNLRESRTA